VYNPYDNAGPNIPGLGKDDVTAQEEFVAFDQLGPLTRKVLNDIMYVRWSGHKTLEVIKEEWLADPLNPVIDRNMADMLLRASAKILTKIRITDETQLRPAGPTFIFAIWLKLS
jgi:hypothetical protein